MPTLIEKMDTIKHHAEQIGRLVNEWANETTDPERLKEIAEEVNLRRKMIRRLERS